MVPIARKGGIAGGVPPPKNVSTWLLAGESVTPRLLWRVLGENGSPQLINLLLTLVLVEGVKRYVSPTRDGNAARQISKGCIYPFAGKGVFPCVDRGKEWIGLYYAMRSEDHTHRHQDFLDSVHKLIPL